MAIHPLALTRGLDRAQIRHAVDHADATIAIGNEPTMILIFGRDDHGTLIEAACVIRTEDVLVVHAQEMRDAYLPLLAEANSLPGTPAGPEALGSEHASAWGISVDGLELTDGLLAELAERAERGHAFDVLRIRLRRGRAAPLTVGEIVRLELDESLFVTASAFADEQGLSMSALARLATQRRLAAKSDA